MAGLGIKDLPNSRLGFQPSRDTGRPDGVITFETVGHCRKEDAKRAQLIAKVILKYPGQFDARALRLLDHLLEGAETGIPRPTLASSLYMRMWREIIIGNLWRFIEELDIAPVVTAALLPTRTWVPASDLDGTEPPSMMRRLASDLDRSGVTRADGYLIAGLHAEFDIRREGYDFHYHMVVGGEKAKAIENLRTRPKYSAPRTEPWEQGLKDRPRVRQSRKPLTNMPDPLTYVVQSFYPHRPTKVHQDGSVTRSGHRYRIPDPFHTQWLLWMDRWSIDDLILLNGMRATRDGFQLTNP